MCNSFTNVNNSNLIFFYILDMGKEVSRILHYEENRLLVGNVVVSRNRKNFTKLNLPKCLSGVADL